MHDIIYAMAVVICLLISVIYGGKRSKQNTDKMEMCRRLNALRGIFAIEIVIGHVVRYESTLLYPFGKFMIISVAFFFFVSAFSMALSYYRKENYLKNFLLLKVGYLLCIAVITYLVNVLIDIIVPMDLGYYEVTGIIGKNFFNCTNWYIWELLIFYICFYFIYRFTKRHLLYFVIITIALIVCFYGKSIAWWASILAFPFGILYAEYFEKFNKIQYSKWGVIITVILCTLGLGGLFVSETNVTGMIISRNILCIGGILVLLYLIGYCCIDNKIIKFLTSNSTAIYLFQFVYLEIAYVYEWDWKIEIPFVLIMTIATAMIFSPIFCGQNDRYYGWQTR